MDSKCEHKKFVAPCEFYEFCSVDGSYAEIEILPWFVIPDFERFEEGSQSTPQSFCSKLIRTTDTPFCSHNYSELFQQ